MKYLVATGDVRPAEGDRPSASKIYRNKITTEGDQKPFKGTTLHETWQDSVRSYSSQPCFGHRPIDAATSRAGDYQWITYAEANEKVTAVASGLAGLGVSAGQKVGVYGANCLEWQLAMQVKWVYTACWVAHNASPCTLHKIYSVRLSAADQIGSIRS